jgi:hypothetical protein
LWLDVIIRACKIGIGGTAEPVAVADIYFKHIHG